MRRKPYPVTQMTGGLDVSLDGIFLTDKSSPNLKMVRFDKGLVKKDLGFALFGTGERVINGSMEANSSWSNFSTPTTCEQSNTQKHGGSYSWKIVTDAAWEGIRSNSIQIAAGANYTYSAWVYPTNTTNMFVTLIKGNDGTTTLQESSAAATANTWTQISGNVTAGANDSGSNGYIRIGANSSGVTAYIDDVSITCDNPTDERIMYIDNYYKYDGTEYLICLTPTRMYQYNSGIWEPVVGTNIFTGGADDQFSSTSFMDTYILTNGQDTVKKWDGTTLAALGGLSGISVTTAKAVTSYNTRVVLGNTTEGATACPYRVRWSATGELEHWDPSTYPDAGFLDLVDTSDWVVGFAILVDRLFVFKERSIWELLPTKDTNIFEARIVIDGVGTYAESTIISLGDMLVFFGTDDVYMFDGTSLKSVGEQLYPWLYTTGEKKVNLSRLNRTASVYIEELGDYVLCLPTIGDSPDWMLRYNVNEENWTQRDFSATAFGFWSQVDFEDWSEASGYWDDTEWGKDWGAVSLPPGAPITLIGQSDGLIWKDDRITTSSELMTWESKDFIFGHSERIVSFVVKCKGSGDFTIWYSTDKGVSWDAGKTLTPDPDNFMEEKVYMNITCDMIRFRITTEATDFQIMWIEPWYVDRSRTTSPSTT